MTTRDSHKKNPFWRENSELMRTRHPDAWRVVAQAPAALAGEACFCADGLPDLAVANNGNGPVFLHGREPGRERGKYLAKLPADFTGAVIMIGMGLGHGALGLIADTERLRTLMIFEPDPAILLRALELVDLRPLLADHRVHLVVGPVIDGMQALKPAARAIWLEDTHIIRQLACHASFPLYQQTGDTVFLAASTLNIEGSSSRVQGRHFLKNRLTNLADLHRYRLADELAGAYAGVPAIVIGGGPSLNRDLAYLKTVRDKAVLICVDSVAPLLLANGIRPHFIASIDANDFIFEKLAGAVSLVTPDDGISLLCTAQVCPQVPKSFPASEAYFFLSDSPLENAIRPLCGSKVVASGIPTVANLAQKAAILMGANPVILVGLDLSYPEAETHSRHTALSARDYLDGLKKSQDIVHVEGTGGGKVLTDRGLLQAKNHLEEEIARHPATTFLNATSKGAMIVGTWEGSLATAMAPHDREIRPLSPERRPDTTRDSAIQDLFAALLSEAKEVNRSAELAAATARQAMDMISGIAASQANTGDFIDIDTKNLIAATEQHNRDCEQHAGLWRILEDLTLDGLKQAEKIRHAIGFVRDRPEQHGDYLSLNMQLFLAVNTTRTDVLDFFASHLGSLLTASKEEREIIARHDSAAQPSTAMTLALAEHYLLNRYMALASRTLAALAPETATSGRLLFLRGCLALENRDAATARECHSQALRLDPALASDIAGFRSRLAERYLDHARQFDAMKLDRNSTRAILLHGLAADPENQKVRTELAAMATADLDRISLWAEEKENEKISRLSGGWAKDLMTNETARECLDGQQTGQFFLLHGKHLLNSNQAEAAEEWLAEACRLLPEEPECFLTISALYFDQLRFDQGIAALRQATWLDRNAGRHWEAIGDFLLNSTMPAEALYAYEQCFLAVADSAWHLLHKIAVCHECLGHSAAAEEARRLALASRPNPLGPEAAH